MAEVLSGKRLQILNFIADCQRDRGYPPSVREIGEAVGLASSATVHTHLAVLQREGYLSKDPCKPRAIQVHFDPDTSSRLPASAVHNVPLVGEVAAGTGVLAEENIEELLPMPEQFTGSGPSFMLRVRGDSMIDAGIFDGDYVVVRQQPEANNGDVVVAGINDGEATVKTFSRKSGRVVLTPANTAYEPMVFDAPDEVTIFGKVVTVVRQLELAGPLLEQLGQAAVGQHLAAGLAGGAVRHFVGLERDALERVAARGRARLAETAVHLEAAAQLGLRQATFPAALELERLGQDVGGGGQEGLALLRRQRAQRGEGRQLGPVQDVVAPPPADARPPRAGRAGRS